MVERREGGEIGDEEKILVAPWHVKSRAYI